MGERMGDITKKGLYEKFITSVEKIWWVIPPVFLVFIYWPLFLATSGPPYYRHDPWYVAMIKSIHHEFSVQWFEDMRDFLSFEGGWWIVLLFMFGFMGIGYVITRKMAIKYRILISSILGAIGLRVGLYAAIYYSWNILGHAIT